MKKITLLVLFVAGFLVNSANAYYLENAVPGTVTVEVNGACAIPATTTQAYLANIHDDDRNLLGWGIVTASGHLLALRENAAIDVNFRRDYTTGEETSSQYIDFVGATLNNFLKVNGVRCEIAKIEPKISSKVSYVKSGASGRAKLNAGFAGYEIKRCQDTGKVESCKARKFDGSIRFKGKW